MSADPPPAAQTPSIQSSSSSSSSPPKQCSTSGCFFYAGPSGFCSCCSQQRFPCSTPECTRAAEAKDKSLCWECAQKQVWDAFQPELERNLIPWFKEWTKTMGKPFVLLEDYWAENLVREFQSKPGGALNPEELLHRLQGKQAPWPLCAVYASTADQLFVHNDKHELLYDYRYVHVLAGFIIDEWNVTKAPPHFECYYDEAYKARPMTKEQGFAHWNKHMRRAPLW